MISHLTELWRYPFQIKFHAYATPACLTGFSKAGRPAALLVEEAHQGERNRSIGSGGATRENVCFVCRFNETALRNVSHLLFLPGRINLHIEGYEIPTYAGL